jgi:peptidoglycan/xylan/chitin deacetylase (PgdA/CDA1 family)
MNLRCTIKRLARLGVSWAAFFGGYCFLAEALGTDRGARILCYHSISDRPKNAFAVSTQDFARQMQFLAERFTIVSVDQWVDLLRGNESLPDGVVAVTIDDGYRDAYTHACPILTRLAIPATVFLPVAFIGSGSSERTEGQSPRADFLSWDQVREMSRAGIAFGSHTLTHVSLTDLTYQEVKYQLERSKARLEAEIGKPVTGFAYPYGTFRDFNPEMKQLVAAAGYSWAVTGISGANNHKTDCYALRRTKVERDDSMAVFEKAVRGALDPWIAVDRLGWFLQARDRRRWSGEMDLPRTSSSPTRSQVER